MPVAPTTPGVYIQELPSGVRTITGVATSIAAFVDFFPRGPLDEAVQVFSWADVERTFGGLHRRSEATYALDQFFRNGGSSAWVVRVTNNLDGTTNALAATAQIATGPLGGAGNALLLTAANPGAWGNQIRARVEPGSGTRFDLVVRETQADGMVIREERYLDLSVAAADPRNVLAIVNAADGMVTVSGSNQPCPSGTMSDPIAIPLPGSLTTVAAKPVKVSLEGPQPGAPNNFVADPRALDLGTASITTLEELASRLEGALRSAQATVTTVPASRPEYSQATVRVVGDRLQVIPGVRTEPWVRFEFAAGTIATALGLDKAANLNIANYRLGFSQAAGVGPRAQAATNTQGRDGSMPRGVDLVGTEAVSPPTGLFALNLADLFNLLCLPRVAKNAIDAGNEFPVNQVDFTISSATDYCERRRAVLLLDPPDTVITPAQMRTFITSKASLRHQNVALHYPRLIIGDPTNDFRDRSIGASGTVAGLCSRTDTARGVWKAPAGTEAVLRGVTRLETKLTDAENGTLNPIAVNCLRTFNLYGHVNWGARTLFGEDSRGSDWKYLPVRRLALYLEETLFRATQWVIFEPNDEPLWAQIRLSVGSFMNDLFHKGALQGSTKEQAYFVRCDATTTTPLDQEKGIVNLVVGFAPLKPAEFLIISIQQIPPRLEV